MEINFMFLLESLLLGVGLAMDATSVAMADGMNEVNMKKSKMISIALLFGFFQGLMPFLGFICVHTLVEYFSAFEKFIPFVAFALLLFIGVKMIIDGMKSKSDEKDVKKLGCTTLVLQAIATSIDALSVGLTTSGYGILMAVVTTLIVGVVTFILCLIGIFLGRKFGTKLSGKAQIMGGIILILIGIEIFLTGIL